MSALPVGVFELPAFGPEHFAGSAAGWPALKIRASVGYAAPRRVTPAGHALTRRPAEQNLASLERVTFGCGAPCGSGHGPDDGALTEDGDEGGPSAFGAGGHDGVNRLYEAVVRADVVAGLGAQVLPVHHPTEDRTRVRRVVKACLI